jgi:hypothetical protein
LTERRSTVFQELLGSSVGLCVGVVIGLSSVYPLLDATGSPLPGGLPNRPGFATREARLPRAAAGKQTDMRTIASLADLAGLVGEWHDDRELYVRWTSEVQRDIDTEVSRDELTGIELPGLSVNCLHIEPWWDGRSITAWLARRLYDYRHLSEKRGRGTSPWVVAGVETGRGPDNEPLIADCEAVAQVDFAVIDEAMREVDGLGDDWGSLDRS